MLDIYFIGQHEPLLIKNAVYAWMINAANISTRKFELKHTFNVEIIERGYAF